MNNEEKLDRIMEIMAELQVTMTGISKDLEAHISKTEDNIKRLEQSQEENKSGHKWIHERVDGIDARVTGIEKNPVFAEWAAIKGRLFSLLWGVLILIGGGIVLTALPKIISLIK